jgi:Uma2 family endonuclease
MMVALPKQRWTEASYLAFERASETKHEYYRGEICAMAGASRNHNHIVANTLASIHAQMRNRPCIVYPGDLRVRVSRTGLYTYPDLSVVCGTPEFEDAELDTLLNPTLIIEVLSPSTAAYDRGEKFQRYRKIETLQEYVLIAQDQHHIERFLRQPDSEWSLADASGLDTVLELRSIGVKLALADVYEKVVFEDSPNADPPQS